MSSKYKLIYFNTRGGAEFNRYLFKYGGIEFEDVRVESEKWPQLKPDTPFGQLPLLEIDGKKINQSKAIGRFLAKKVNLVGNDDWENLEIDAIVDTIYDLAEKIVKWLQTTDKEEKEDLLKRLLEETVPFYLSRLDRIAEGYNGYLALGRLTWADIYFVANFETFELLIGTPILSNYSHLLAVVANVNNTPSIKDWISKRPEL